MLLDLPNCLVVLSLRTSVATEDTALGTLSSAESNAAAEILMEAVANLATSLTRRKKIGEPDKVQKAEKRRPGPELGVRPANPGK